MFTEINSIEEFTKLKEEQAVVFYFSTDTCNVCKVLKPKVAGLITEKFPGVKLAYVDSQKLPELAAQNRVFAAPTILVFFNGREYIRKIRNVGIEPLKVEIERPYSMLFD